MSATGRAATATSRRLQLAPPSGKKVAVVGSGPGGLTAAGELAKYGHDVTVFEALHKPGGVLVYGIPEFRLPKKIVEEEVARLERAGVKIVCNTVIGRTYTVPELREQFDAVFIANGAGLPVFMNVPGENLKGVYSANEYLTRVNLMAAYQFPRADTPVLKGQRDRHGRRRQRRHGLRPHRQAPGRGVLDDRLSPHAQGNARARRGDPSRGRGRASSSSSSSRRWKCSATRRNGSPASSASACNWASPTPRAAPGPIVIPGSEFVVPCDVVVVAIGTRANPLLTATCPDLKLNKWGNIIVDDKGMTSLPGVFAGGDIVRGAATVILAMGDGKRAAKAMDEYLRGVQTA